MELISGLDRLRLILEHTYVGIHILDAALLKSRLDPNQVHGFWVIAPADKLGIWVSMHLI